MLNEMQSKVLVAIDNLCETGYNTLDKLDILATVNKQLYIALNDAMLDDIIMQFNESKIIDLKYLDKDNYCLSLTELAENAIKLIKIEEENKNISKWRKKKTAPVANIVDSNLTTSLDSAERNLMVGSKSTSKLKTFLLGILGGLLGGALSGGLIVLLQILL